MTWIDDWDEHIIARGDMAPLSTRHQVSELDLRFMPEHLSIRCKHGTKTPVIVRISGGRLHGTSVDRSVLDSIEYDLTRDVLPHWLFDYLDGKGLL
jgi:hypothetical protein